jgi:hypothetical protein
MNFLDNKWRDKEFIFADGLLFCIFWLINFGLDNKSWFWKIYPKK